jgi:hypothetical protein
MTKAVRTEGTDIRRGVDWVLSRRGWIKAFEDRITCGDWTIRNDEVDNAILVTTRDIIFPAKVLIVQTKSANYQFGLNPWCGISTQLPFPFREERKPIKWSAFSVLLRIGVVVLLVYLVFFRDW